MEELIKRIQSEIVLQAEEIFKHFYAKLSFDIVEIPNPYGGNSELHVGFYYVGRLYNGKTKRFIYCPASQTEQGFIDEIRSYLLDCVYGFINLGY